MKTTFSRNLTTTAIILLLALVLVGTTFQALVRDYLTDNAVGQLQQNSSSLADLAAAYCSDVTARWHRRNSSASASQ